MEFALDITEYIRHGSDVILLLLSLYIFVVWNKAAGALIFYYSSTAIIFVLSLNKMFGLGFIAEMLSRKVGEPLNIEMVVIAYMLSISEAALLIGFVLLVKQIHSYRAVK